MNFDLTPEVKLNLRERALYRRWRLFLYIFSILGASYLAYTILFPTAYFTFSFSNPSSTKNTIIAPRVNGNLPEKGIIEKNELVFDAALLGNYSKAIIEFTLNKKSDGFAGGTVTIQKGYQAYFYPTGEEINYQPEKDANGIIDGSLVAYGESVYILSENFYFPIDSGETFLAQGYNWNDLQKISPDIIASYQKNKLFSLQSPHPNGTILSTDNGKKYLIKNGVKHPLTQGSWNNLPARTPIAVSAESLTFSQSCDLKKANFGARKYICEMPLENFTNLSGMDYQFKNNFGQNIRIEEINVRFKKEFGLMSLKNTILDILRRVKNNYAQ